MMGAPQATLLEERQPGVLLSVVTLLLGIVSRSYEGYTSLVSRIVRILDRLKNKEVSNDYTYYGIPSPWLQVLSQLAYLLLVSVFVT
jgi:AP-2 complex subunit alpha